MSRTPSLDASLLRSLRQSLEPASAEFSTRSLGEAATRQPVHVVYGGAHLFQADAARKLGDRALAALQAYAPSAEVFAEALELRAELASAVYSRVVAKLEREPVEDLRIDFEDGYGFRSDAEEDGHAVSAAEALAQGMAQGTLPEMIGLRIKALTSALFARAARTLDLFVGTLAARSGGELPPTFLVTLPKVTSRAQVTALVRLVEALEVQHGVAAGAIRLELMVETPQSLFDADGAVVLPGLVRAAEGRCVAAHFGTYDYTASLNVTAAHQTMDHRACDFAKQLMQVSLAGTGVRVSDGATNVMPVGPHRAGPGVALSAAQAAENGAVVHRAWRLSARHIRRSLVDGFYQGWDLHPAQLPVRYAATYAFFLEGLPAAAARLKSFVTRAAQATLLGDVFDDAATGQGLLNFFLLGRSSGALTDAEVLSAGVTLEELQTRSFLRILEGRR